MKTFLLCRDLLISVGRLSAFLYSCDRTGVS
jgi:hypothetical protein